ncbi:hypothetical protein RHMOL_Rhmol07G0059700 [Rhododendron molle]|uniref:Uncharacterized protein n=6 Tax=Rhododendron molle TaxID=49168 RepID=A0ACC0MYX1_RHOML|nr:hypothetical protein RHMOL_Rhmol07G0059700 [Rhododendron molle]KAI8545700.1 hypothetical protein RHMOL_Rhmol07G0059700 [Rhododendron molle]KAI8545701.1 hypothetical protein RHMOL_Rhmol07G0059700 [Rhododendron molle]KAI8545702.1 hypothetical protein RHMOL_Rhmol07G0059700 [Rhododendron molle]KAI8545703.1 hypothetical protein RHMOL_Rhmol07G0059700 [Rhododendron molle]
MNLERSSLAMFELALGCLSLRESFQLHAWLHDSVYHSFVWHRTQGLKTWALPREGDHFEHNSILLLLHYWGLHVNGFIYIAALGPDEIWMLVLT